MQSEEEAANALLETIRRELASIIEEGSDDYGSHLSREIPQSCDNKSKICLATTRSLTGNISSEDELFSKKEDLNTSSICNINDSIQNLQNNLDESCKTFKAIAESFEKINFGSLKLRIKDFHLNERCSDSIKLIVNDLRQSFDEKYVQNRLEDLTSEVSSKFRNHPGEFGDISEISEFFRTCSRLEQGLVKLRQQRDDCMYLQKRMTRVTEASYERVNAIQQRIVAENETQQNKDY